MPILNFAPSAVRNSKIFATEKGRFAVLFSVAAKSRGKIALTARETFADGEVLTNLRSSKGICEKGLETLALSHIARPDAAVVV